MLGENEAVAAAVEHGQHEALIGAGVRERVVPDDSEPLHRPLTFGVRGIEPPAQCQ